MWCQKGLLQQLRSYVCFVLATVSMTLERKGTALIWKRAIYTCSSTDTETAHLSQGELYIRIYISYDLQRPYQVSIVARAGTLLGHTHTETGQAAASVILAEMKGSRLTAGARRAFSVHL